MQKEDPDHLASTANLKWRAEKKGRGSTKVENEREESWKVKVMQEVAKKREAGGGGGEGG